MKVRCLGDAKTAATASDDVSTQKQLGLATCKISNNKVDQPVNNRMGSLEMPKLSDRGPVSIALARSSGSLTCARERKWAVGG